MTESRKKIKVALICHFSNNEIQNILQPSKRISELAPWIPMFVKVFENTNEIELYVISPHKYIRKLYHFELRGVKYYFYNAHILLWGRNWPSFFKWDMFTNFLSNKKMTRKLIKKINPDVINLFGAENAYYSSTILQFKNYYPVLISVQGFIFKCTTKHTKAIKNSIKIEHQILTEFEHHAVQTNTLGKDITQINPKAKIFKLNYPISIPPNFICDKEYDLVFFARVTKDKGIEDLLHALVIIKKEKKDITLCVIGGGRLEPFQALARELGIFDNVTWAGFLPTQTDVHRLASRAKISVLPTYHDIISGTIIESLFLELPVVAYDVGSIHEVNEYEEIISLVDKGDIQNLANSIKELLNNKKLLEDKATKGRKRALEMFARDNDQIRMDLLKVYNAVIADFKNK